MNIIHISKKDWLTTKPNSTFISSYGIYDKETIEKVVKLVVTLEFKIGN